MRQPSTFKQACIDHVQRNTRDNVRSEYDALNALQETAQRMRDNQESFSIDYAFSIDVTGSNH